MRVLLLPVLLISLASAAPVAAPQDLAIEAAPFDEWLGELIAEARARNFSEALIEQALVGLQPLARVIQSDRSQAEAVVGFDRYYRTRVNAQVVNRGRELSRQHRALLDRIEAEYNVQRRFLIAIWSIETRYGQVTGNTPIFQALATLAWEPRRAAFFRGELFNALTMVSQGYIDVGSMTGSWAGAMGQPQFMPSSYLKFAQDFDGDGRRDIWRSVPDTLASIANYLKAWGWSDEWTWGREVRVTPAVRARIERETSRRTEGCSAIRTMTERMPLTEWQAMGVRLANGATLPDSTVAAGLVDTDSRSFLVYENYDAILSYNCAHYYALTVALLAEQLR